MFDPNMALLGTMGYFGLIVLTLLALKETGWRYNLAKDNYKADCARVQSSNSPESAESRKRLKEAKSMFFMKALPYYIANYMLFLLFACAMCILVALIRLLPMIK
jgi:hypothetical protein